MHSKHSIYFILALFLLLFSFKNTNGQIYSLSLSDPAHGDTISILRPDFYWNAIGINSRTSFSIKLVKIQGGQNKSEAISANSPTIFQGPVTLNALIFPSTNNDLDSASHYCWQVTFYDTGVPVAISEIEDFYTPFPPNYKGLYWNLHQSNRNSKFRNDRLSLNYNNRYKLPNLDLIIYNSTNGELIFQNQIQVNSGVNFIDISNYPGFPELNPGEYSVEITTKANENFHLIFIKQ
jgi:hypothetical protein